MINGRRADDAARRPGTRPAHLPQSARNVVLHDCGHVPMWDDPAQVANLLLSGSIERRAAA